MVLPAPGSPRMSTTRSGGKPPPIISSKPGIPVDVLGEAVSKLNQPAQYPSEMHKSFGCAYYDCVCLDRMGDADSTSGCTAEPILNQLKTKQFGRTLILLDECASTNDAGRKLASNGAPHGSLILAATQTAGRGRHGRRWVSPLGGIWMTLILKSPITLPIEALPLVGALSVADSIHNQLGIDSRVRWPNDVVVHGSKVAGLIAEGHQRGNSLEFVLLGIGVNANFESHEIHDRTIDAVTLMELNNGRVDSSRLVCNILLELEDLLTLAASNPPQLLELLRGRDYSTGRTIKVAMEDKVIEGVFVDYESPNMAVLSSKGQMFVVDSASAISVDYSN